MPPNNGKPGGERRASNGNNSWKSFNLDLAPPTAKAAAAMERPAAAWAPSAGWRAALLRLGEPAPDEAIAAAVAAAAAAGGGGGVAFGIATLMRLANSVIAAFVAGGVSARGGGARLSSHATPVAPAAPAAAAPRAGEGDDAPPPPATAQPLAERVRPVAEPGAAGDDELKKLELESLDSLEQARHIATRAAVATVTPLAWRRPPRSFHDTPASVLHNYPTSSSNLRCSSHDPA